MENKTRNTILVFCAIAVTSAICFKVISDELDKRKAIKAVESFSTEITNDLKNSDSTFLNKTLKQKNVKNNELVEANKHLSQRAIKAENELRDLKRKFAVQLEAESHKEKIIWSDGTSKPKYNQVQEGIDWSKK